MKYLAIIIAVVLMTASSGIAKSLTLGTADSSNCYKDADSRNKMILDNASGTSTFTVVIDGVTITTMTVTSSAGKMYTWQFPFDSITVTESGGTAPTATIDCYR